MKKLPLAKTNDVVIQTLGKEILIYDFKKHKAYSLNETSSIVYQACDGKTSFEELKSKHKFTDNLIFLTLDGLQKENLIEEDISLVSPFHGMSRREAIRKVGLGTMIALPLISSLVAPTAAMAQSAACIDDGQPSANPNYPTADGSSCYTSTPDSSCCSGVSNGAYNGISMVCVNRVCGEGTGF